PDGQGNWTVTASNLPVDGSPYAILAIFTSTDSSFANSNSNQSPLSQVINSQPTQTKIGSLTGVTAGESITLTATVTADNPEAGVPAGSVTFLNESNPSQPRNLGTGTSDGKGHFTLITSLSAGTHKITADFKGANGDFADSSDSVSVQI